VSYRAEQNTGCLPEQSKEYIMKKILFIAILAGAAYFGYKKFVA